MLKSGYIYKDDLFFIVGAGVTTAWIEKRDVSNVTGISYEGGSGESKTYPQGYLGLLYKTNILWQSGVLEIGYNNRRGIVAGVGGGF